MIKAIVYSLDGYEAHAEVDENTRLVSRLQSNQAIETWKSGLVKGRLAIGVKTVGAVKRFLEKVPEGAAVEITYELLGSQQKTQERRIVRYFAMGGHPVLLPNSSLPVTDQQIVMRLGAQLGSFIQVTYRLIECKAAWLEPRQSLGVPNKELLVRVMCGASQLPQFKQAWSNNKQSSRCQAEADNLAGAVALAR